MRASRHTHRPRRRSFVGRGKFRFVTTHFVLRIATLTVLLTVGMAHADVNKAKQLYGEARTQYNLNEFAKALDLFKRAYQEHADPAFLFNIAQCERALGRYDDAEKSYRAYLRESPELPDERTSEVKALIGAMAAAAQQQRANPSPPSAAPSRATSPSPLPPPAATQPPAVTYVDTGRPMRIGGIAIAAVGIGVAALGGVFAGLSYKAGQDAYHASNGVYDPNADARQTSFRNADIACFVVGGAAAVAGTVVWLIGRKRRETPTIRAASIQPTPNGVAF